MTQHRYFGRTGVRATPLTLGTMNFGAWGEPDHDRSIEVVHRALDAGINVIDTADLYSAGESEVVVGKALVGRQRDDIILASKFHGKLGPDVNQQGNSRRWVVRAVEDSLRRLGVDHIDLYQIHKPDPHTDLDETLSALTSLVDAGKIRYFGTSCFPAHLLVKAQWVARDRGHIRPVSEQPPYSVLSRKAEVDVLPVAQEYELGVLTWSPLAGGWLSGRSADGSPLTATDRHRRLPARYDAELPLNVIKRQRVEQLSKLASDAGITLPQLAIAFVLAHPAVTTVIVGPRSIEHLESVLGAEEIALSADVLDAIDQIVAPGVTLNPADEGYVPPSIADSSLRRRA
ncbi:aldo/keto reductase [Mycolicibacterium tusciae]|uniref:aldo/keto reductase n=1 Tax=Mycolicibacterium tusciae TaxID=75922 RepID=UPI00024A2ED7|nr:aldo/keto reductase [Mycolicibacterium tusciae]